jgi:hypothetical protein
LPDRVKLRSCERPEARRGRILDVFDRGATKGRYANPRFHGGRQTVRCSRPPTAATHSPTTSSPRPRSPTAVSALALRSASSSSGCFPDGTSHGRGGTLAVQPASNQQTA